MTSKRDLRAQVERLTAQLDLARGERNSADKRADDFGVVVDRLATQRDALQEHVRYLEFRIQELSGVLEQQDARGSVLTISSQPGRFPDVRSLSTPDEAA